MKKQISFVFAVIMVITVILFGCSSGPSAPEFGAPTEFQQVLNSVMNDNPIDIAGKQVKITFEGNFWRGKVDGEDLLAGDCKIEEKDGGASITLNQTWMYVDTGKKVPGTGAAIAKWQQTPGPEIVLDYVAGPPAKVIKQ